MLEEVLEAMRPRSGGRYVDGTVGGGGHAFAVLKASAPTGLLFGCDRDGDALEAASVRLSIFESRYELRRGTFVELGEWIPAASVDGVLVDLGVSSPQLDRACRGFSFLQEGPLDMRMDLRGGQTAADLVNDWPAEDLARVFWEYGDERLARRIAAAIEQARRQAPFRTTLQLATLVERVAPRMGRRTHPATRVFQALRMVVNDEIGMVERGLPVLFRLLKPGGRLCVLTFHSLEDRLVKRFGQEMTRDYDVQGEVDVPALRVPRAPWARWWSRKPVKPTDAETMENPRARSAQLRVLERTLAPLPEEARSRADWKQKKSGHD